MKRIKTIKGQNVDYDFWITVKTVSKKYIDNYGNTRPSRDDFDATSNALVDEIAGIALKRSYAKDLKFLAK